MRKTVKTKISIGNLRKFIFRILLGVVSVAILLIATVFLQGYLAASKHVSYLPVIPARDFESNQHREKIIKLKCSWYELQVDEYGKIAIVTLKGDTIMSNLTYFSSYEGAADNWGLKKTSVKLSSDSTISIMGEGHMNVKVSILLSVHKDNPELEVAIRTHYGSNTTVYRETLVAAFDIPVSKVFKKNRQVDYKSFDPEYWLQQQGVQFGNGSRSALIYHTPYVSSLQLDAKRNLLFVNLEYYLDHPFIHIPYQEDEGGRWVDRSNATYTEGAERNNSFSINLGEIPAVTPRIMLVPNGYLAGYVFTEHADGGTIKTHRAAYFGSENISNLKDATGGFVGHKIPVTKSVFYADYGGPAGSSVHPDSIQFLDYLDQLQKTNDYEICLHTPERDNSNRKSLEESIKSMKERYNTITWIDHGMYKGKVNRECIVADGLNPNSRNYAADLWEKYETRYFWSPAVELLRDYSLKENLMKFRFYSVSQNVWKRYLSPEELNKIKFGAALREMVTRYEEEGESNSLLSYKGSAYPTPLFWQHPTQTRNFYSWTTDYGKPYSSLSSKKVMAEQKLLNKLILEWGVFINHGYYVRNNLDDGVLSQLNGKMVINPYFDQILGLMSRMRDDGDLYITTIRDLLDYWIRIEKISFKYMPNGVIYIYNNGTEQIKGLSLVVNADTIRVNGEIPKFRRTGDDTIFWLDIKAGECEILEIR